MLACALGLLLAVADPPPPSLRVLVVGSNVSQTPGRARLAFADDDAAKYGLFFRAFTPVDQITVLTAFDGDSQRLWGAHLQPNGLPTVAEVDAAFARLASEAQAAAPGSVEFVFVFAGHGDVDGGAGVLELADGPLPSARLLAALKRLAPHRVHVVLDSCNSFFMLAPRKAGGRRYATPDDVAAVFKNDLPHVGVVLSTSSENEVYEWSEIQSGVFSHLVRSAGIGLADADRDGIVRYDELEAFLSIATRSIANPVFRPRVFVRGADGPSTPLFRLGSPTATSVSLDLPAPVRLVVRDELQVRWFDARLEAGSPVMLSLPTSLASSLEFELDDGVNRHATLLLDGNGKATLRSVEGAPRTARGLTPGLEGLFQDAYGAKAVERFEHETHAPQVFGLSRSEAARLKSVVLAFAARERDARTEALVMGGVDSAVAVTTTAVELSRHPTAVGPVLVNGSITLSTVTGIAAIQLGRLASPEGLVRLAELLTSADDPAPILVKLDQSVARLRRREQTARTLNFVVAGVGSTIWAAILALNEISYAQLPAEERAAGFDARLADRISRITTLAAWGGSVLVLALQHARFTFFDLWQHDPAIEVRVGWSLVPVPGGLMSGLTLSF